MADEVRDAVGRAEHDLAVVGIVLTGAGKGFCAGADMNDLSTISGAGWRTGPTLTHRCRRPRVEAPGDASWGEDLRGTYTYLLSVPKPVIARDQRPGRRDGRADRPVVRPALHERGDRADDVVRPARPRRRVGLCRGC